MLRLGITGNIACGKSLVGSILEELGYPVIDSDKVVHELLAKENDVTKKLILLCQPHEITSSEETQSFINRKKLGAVLFSSSKLKTKIEKLIHPEVFNVTEKFFSEQQKTLHKLAANLIPQLFESNSQNRFNQVWLVYCKKSVQKKRLKERNPELNEQEIEKRLEAQMSQELKKDLADCIIDNSGAIEKTKAQVKMALAKIIS